VSFASQLSGLIANDVHFVVVGGVAAAAHGSVRVTSDLDICYDASDAKNVDRLARLLASWEAYPRGVEQGLPFMMDERTLRGAPIMTLVTTEGALDILDRIAGVGDYDAVARDSTPVDAFDLRFRILSLPALIKAKRAAGRPRDLDQLPELEALLALSKRKPSKTT
jgi:hypothetical protein